MFDRIRASWRFFRDPSASLSVKLLFVTALAYVVWPVDFVPDFVPVLGWLDDLGFLGIATAFLLSSISPYRKGGERAAQSEGTGDRSQLTTRRQRGDRGERKSERPIVTEVWNRGYPKEGTWGHFRGPHYQVETEGTER
ncbi:MAG: YkvA family protein [Polyangiaceae bacterium]